MTLRRDARERLKLLAGTTRGRRLASAVAGWRRRDLVLLWHRVGPNGPRPHEVVPTVPVDEFRRQVAALGELGDVVPVGELLQPRPAGSPPRFALTFDDDYGGHLAHAAPVLTDLRVSGAVFLSGRSLAGVGAYWWEVLEDEVASRGLRAAAEAAGVAGATSPAAVAAAIEGTAAADRLAARAADVVADHLDAAGIAALVAGAWTVGFHTLHHPVLPRLADGELVAALVDGRDAVARAAGASLELFAYPHGKATAAVAAATRAAGYRAAFTGRAGPMAPSADQWLLPRWEGGHLPLDAFLAGVALRLTRPAPPARPARRGRRGPPA